MLHEEQLEHGKTARRLAPVAAPSVLRRNASEFLGFRQSDEQALVLVKFANLVLDEVEEARLNRQPVARDNVFRRFSPLVLSCRHYIT